MLYCVLRTQMLLIADQVSRIFEFQQTLALKFNIELNQKSNCLMNSFKLCRELINKSHRRIARDTNTHDTEMRLEVQANGKATQCRELINERQADLP